MLLPPAGPPLTYPTAAENKSHPLPGRLCNRLWDKLSLGGSFAALAADSSMVIWAVPYLLFCTTGRRGHASTNTRNLRR